MNERRPWPFEGSCQSLIRSNLDSAGQFPSAVMSWPTYSKRRLRKSHFGSFRETWYLIKILADAVEVVQKGGKVAGEQKDVVNDHTATFVGGLRVQGIEKGIPLFLHDLHHSCVRGGGVLRSERHHLESVLLPVGAEKRKLLTVHKADTNLMVSLPGIEADKPEVAKTVTEIVDGVVTARDRILEREGNCIKLPV